MPEVLAGRIGPIGLPALLHLVELERLTGWLRVHGGALVGFSGGAPVYARADQLSGYEAIVSLFFLEDAPFSVNQELKPHGEPIAPVFDLILEGCRRRDLWDALSTAVFVQGDGIGADARGPVGDVVPWLDGTRTLLHAVQLSGQEPSVVIDAVARLVDRGALRPQEVTREAESEEFLVSALLARGGDRRALLTESTVPPSSSATSVEELPSEGHRGLVSPLAQFGLTHSVRRDSQGRSFLAWAMRRTTEESSS